MRKGDIKFLRFDFYFQVLDNAEKRPKRVNIMRFRNALLTQDCALVFQPYQRGTYLL